MYASQQDMIDRYGPDALLAATDLDGVVAADRVANAIADASDEIDSYVGKRYSLPLVSVPRVLSRLTVDIAVYRMADEASQTEEKRKRYEDAVKLLDSIAKGKVSLGLEADTDTSPAEQMVEMASQPRQMHRPNLNRVL